MNHSDDAQSSRINRSVQVPPERHTLLNEESRDTSPKERPVRNDEGIKDTPTVTFQTVYHPPKEEQSHIFEQLDSLAKGEEDLRCTTSKQDSSSAMSGVECDDSMIIGEMPKELDDEEGADDGNDGDMSIALEDLVALEDLRQSSLSQSTSSAGMTDKFHEGSTFVSLLSDTPSSRAVSAECHDSLILEELENELDQDTDSDDDKSITLDDLRKCSARRRSTSTSFNDREQPKKRQRGEPFFECHGVAARHNDSSLLSEQQSSSSAISFEFHDSVIFEEIAKELDGGDNEGSSTSITLEDLSQELSMAKLSTISNLSVVSRFQQSIVDKEISSGNLVRDGFHFSFRRHDV